MKLREFVSKSCTFLASAASEPTGERSTRRLVLIVSMFAGVAFAAGLLIRHPEMCVDLIKFVIMTAGGIYAGTKGIELVKGPPAPPAA
jgi:hypothetical protein